MATHAKPDEMLTFWPIGAASAAAPFLRHIFEHWISTPYAVGLSFAVGYALLSPCIPRNPRRPIIDNWHWLPRALAFAVLTGGPACLIGFVLY